MASCLGLNGELLANVAGDARNQDQHVSDMNDMVEPDSFSAMASTYTIFVRRYLHRETLAHAGPR
jgi:hypothetical protein